MQEQQPLDREEIRIRLIPLRLILGAMVAGLVVFALAATWMLMSGFTPRPELLPWFLGALAVMGAGEIAAWPVLRSAMVRALAGRDRPTAARALETFFRLRLVGAALAEGFGLFGVVVYLVSGSQVALIAPALAVFTLLRLQPDPDAFRDFARSAGAVDLPP